MNTPRFKRVAELTDAEKLKVSDMTGKTQLWLLEGRHLAYMSRELNLPPQMVRENMCEAIYEFLGGVGGLKYYLTWLWRKKH